MKILMVLASRFPPDVRVEREARALLRAGHELHLLCYGREGDPAQENWEGMTVHRIRVTRALRPLFRKVNAALRVVSFVDRYWARNLERLVSVHGIEAIHVHDLPLVRTALSVARRHGLRVVADMHENYPYALEFYVPQKTFSPIARFRYGVRRWERHERKVLPKCDRVLAVAEEMKERLVSEGIPGADIAVVENTVDLDEFDSYPIDNSLVRSYRDNYVIGYVGGFTGHRGLDTAVRAMQLVVKDAPDSKLILVGYGPVREQLEHLVQDLGLEKHIEFHGKQPFRLVPTYVQLSDVCLLPLISNPHTEYGLPNKVFEYWAKGKAIIVSSCKGIKRVVEEAKGGLVFTSGDSHGLADAILALRDEQLRNRLGSAGRSAVAGQYNWRMTSQKLLRVYQELDDLAPVGVSTKGA